MGDFVTVGSFQKLPRLATSAFSTTTKQMKNKVPDHQKLFQVSMTSLGHLDEKQSQTKKTRGVLTTVDFRCFLAVNNVNKVWFWQQTKVIFLTTFINVCRTCLHWATLTWLGSSVCVMLQDWWIATIVGWHLRGDSCSVLQINGLECNSVWFYHHISQSHFGLTIKASNDSWSWIGIWTLTSVVGGQRLASPHQGRDHWCPSLPSNNVHHPRRYLLHSSINVLCTFGALWCWFSMPYHMF